MVSRARWMVAALAGVTVVGLSVLARPMRRPVAGAAREVFSETLRFTEEAESRGLRFRLGHDGRTPLNIQETLGTGVALWDFDADGWLDVFLVGQRGARAGGAGALFRGRRDGTFEERTRGSGLDVAGDWHGCAVGDVNNDGLPDLLLTGKGDLRLFRNLGAGRFNDMSREAGLPKPGALDWHTSAGFADVNRDGALDLFVARYVRFGPQDLPFCNVRGVRAACGPRSYEPQQGSLFLQQADGRFMDATRPFGMRDQHGKTLGVAFGDFNGDGFPDLYLANDEVPGDLYLNRKGATFQNVGMSSGTAFGAQGREQGGMGVDWGDYDGDGRLDLVVATFQNEDHGIYRNTGSGFFEESGAATGLSGVTRPFVTFGARFIDYDSDGQLDFWSANGHIQDNVNEVDAHTTYRQRSQVFHNVNTRFTEARGTPDHPIERPIVGRGLAVGDIDRDGDPDVLVSDLEGPPLLLINQEPGGNWLSLRLVGTRSNRMGLGARVIARVDGKELVRQCQTGGSYLSASDAAVHLGLGVQTRADVTVEWPSGMVTRRSDVAAGQHLVLTEGSD